MVKVGPVNPATLGKARGYANGMRAGDFLFVAGQIGGTADREGDHAVVPGGFVPQFELALSNVLEVVRAAGGRPDSIVEMTVFVRRMGDYRAARAELRSVWQRLMGKHYPAMTLVEVVALFHPDAVVEIRAVAALG